MYKIDEKTYRDDLCGQGDSASDHNLFLSIRLALAASSLVLAPFGCIFAKHSKGTDESFLCMPCTGVRFKFTKEDVNLVRLTENMLGRLQGSASVITLKLDGGV